MIDFPLVSVIIPTYKRPEFLEKTLRAVHEQTYKNLEIIVVSDGCSEKNKEIIEQCVFPIIYIEQDNWGGPASPRNRGVREASGEFIAFCDEDDIWVPDKIFLQISAMLQNPDYGLSYGKMMRFNSEREWINPDEEIETSDLKSLLYRNNIPISSVVVRKSLVDKSGLFSENKKIGGAEDYEFLIRCSCHAKFLFIHKYLIKYWSGEEGRMTHNSPYVKKLMNYVLCIFFSFKEIVCRGYIKKRYLIFPFVSLLVTVFKIFLYQTISRMNSKIRYLSKKYVSIFSK